MEEKQDQQEENRGSDQNQEPVQETEVEEIETEVEEIETQPSEEEEADLAQEIEETEEPRRTQLTQEVSDRRLFAISKGDVMDAFGAVLNPDFQRDAIGTFSGIAVGEFIGEGLRVSSGLTGLGGLTVKGVGKAGLGLASLWIGSMIEDEGTQRFFNMGAVGSWAGFFQNVVNFSAGGSPTSDFGATSQFAASMGARLRAAQISGGQPTMSSRARRTTSSRGPRAARRASTVAQESQKQEEGTQEQPESTTSPDRFRRLR